MRSLSLVAVLTFVLTGCQKVTLDDHIASARAEYDMLLPSLMETLNSKIDNLNETAKESKLKITRCDDSGQNKKYVNLTLSKNKYILGDVSIAREVSPPVFYRAKVIFLIESTTRTLEKIQITEQENKLIPEYNLTDHSSVLTLVAALLANPENVSPTDTAIKHKTDNSKEAKQFMTKMRAKVIRAMPIYCVSPIEIKFEYNSESMSWDLDFAPKRPDFSSLQPLIDALESFEGGNSAEAKGFAEELKKLPYLVHPTGNLANIGDWSYNAERMTLTKNVLSLPDEEQWCEIKLAVNKDGKLIVKSIELIIDILEPITK